MVGFNTRDKGKCFRITMSKVQQSVQRDGLLVFDGHSVNALPAMPRLASPPHHPRLPSLYLR